MSTASGLLTTPACRMLRADLLEHADAVHRIAELLSLCALLIRLFQLRLLPALRISAGPRMAAYALGARASQAQEPVRPRLVETTGKQELA